MGTCVCVCVGVCVCVCVGGVSVCVCVVVLGKEGVVFGWACARGEGRDGVWACTLPHRRRALCFSRRATVASDSVEEGAPF